jgi:hypothetical protein
MLAYAQHRCVMSKAQPQQCFQHAVVTSNWGEAAIYFLAICAFYCSLVVCASHKGLVRCMGLFNLAVAMTRLFNSRPLAAYRTSDNSVLSVDNRNLLAVVVPIPVPVSMFREWVCSP